MSETHETKDSLSETLEQVVSLLEKDQLVEDLVQKREVSKHGPVESLAHRQTKIELENILNILHPADVAHILEALPLDDRLYLWDLVKVNRDGDILLEVSDAVRQTLIADMDSEELLAAAEQLDTDELADLAPDLPKDVLEDLMDSLDALNRERLQSTLSYPEDTVGALMDFDIVTIREDVTVEVALRYLRRLKELPNHTDKIFVVDRHDKIQGVLPLSNMLVNDLDSTIKTVMASDTVLFYPDDVADEAAKAFERYDLV
ncbi:MAG TPA: magnesium transporter, partial [Methylophilaceae bacterium]|nr:magnesium transporter [Methylophilaceae bacterium]